MKRNVVQLLIVAGLVSGLIAVAALNARQDRGSGDPRIALKPGLRNAGIAARSLELVATLPKPPGFFDPQAPAGQPTPPEKPEGQTPPQAQAPGTPPAQPTPRFGGLDYANSDIAFRGNLLFLGNFSGFNIYDISSPKSPKLVTSVVCPGGQGDLSVHGNLLFMSVEETRGRIDCGAQGVTAAASPERFRGVRVFDISEVSRPKQIAAVQTCRGSHTHTLLVDPDDKANVYIYGSGTAGVRPAEELAGCSGLDPKEDPNTALFSIDVIQVPLDAPQNARVVSRPRIFADPKTGAISGLWQGGDHGPGTQKTSTTNQCHDITVFPEAGLAAGACSGNGILLDISDPVNPVRLDHVVDKSFAYWHSATFNNDATKVVFTDEWGGGTRPRCRKTDPETWGANAIFDIVDRKLRFASYYKLPAPQADIENCVAHNGSIVPVPGRDIMVQGWYQGGISAFDFTDSAKPVEIAYFDRGPVDASRLITAGHWAAYWFNGHIYGPEMARGLDVLRLKAGPELSQAEIDAAASVTLDVFNPQQQPRMSWRPSPAVARAYLDQLSRGGGLDASRAGAITSAIAKKDRTRLASLAGELEQQAAAASGAAAARLKALAATLRAL